VNNAQPRAIARSRGMNALLYIW